MLVSLNIIMLQICQNRQSTLIHRCSRKLGSQFSSENWTLPTWLTPFITALLLLSSALTSGRELRIKPTNFSNTNIPACFMGVAMALTHCLGGLLPQSLSYPSPSKWYHHCHYHLSSPKLTSLYLVVLSVSLFVHHIA